jgi:lipopolysaccharide/colanic/teichoic acid biosynthesis glycosyltransferase
LNPASFGSAAIAQDEQLLRTSLPLRGERLSADGLGLLLKRVVDVAGASMGLLFLAPVMLTIAILIRLDSPGPVLFRQVRRGHRGRPFRMLKSLGYDLGILGKTVLVVMLGRGAC